MNYYGESNISTCGNSRKNWIHVDKILEINNESFPFNLINYYNKKRGINIRKIKL